MLIPLTLHDVLAQIAQECPEVQGAVVANGDGLVLADLGMLQGDTPAACAASVSRHIEENLSFIQPTGMSELLLWCAPGLWHISRLAHGHLLMVYAASADHAGAVRLASRIAGQRMALMLAPTE